MKKLVLAMMVLAVVGLFIHSSAYALVTIDFESIADNTAVTNQYTSSGIIFTNGYGDSLYETWFSKWLSGEIADGENGIAAPDITGYFVDTQDPSVRTTTNFIAADGIFADLDVYLDVYDINGSLLATNLAGYSIGYATWYNVAITQEGIASFRFYWLAGGSPVGGGIYGDDIAGIDNLQFNEVGGSAAVPEPASMTLLGLGLLGLAGLKKNSKLKS